MAAFVSIRGQAKLLNLTIRSAAVTEKNNDCPHP